MVEENPKQKLEPKSLQPKLSDFTFGIECENYVRSWRTDHEDTHETVSRIFPKFNGVLLYMRNMVERHKTDEEFWLHSAPEDFGSTCSAHIHFKCNIPEWNEYKYFLYERLFRLIKLYNIFFKNSPDKERGFFSRRHHDNDWCELIKLEKDSFLKGGRHYTALTLNDQYDTIEFRYNEVPKHLNQLALFYYLLRIAIDHNIDIPEIPDKLEMHSFESLKKPLNKNIFSYKDIKSISYYKQTYLKLVEEFGKEVDAKIKDKFYDFIKNKYNTFHGLVTDCLNNDLTEFKEFFEKKSMSEEDWSNHLKNKFYKPIKKELIKI